jgi:hypothetical protein
MPHDIGQARQVRVAATADRAARQAAILWRKQMGPDFDSGWANIGETVSALTARAQTAVAAGASAYLARTASADGISADGATDVLPGSFAGVDASGRTLDGLLYGAVTSAKTVIGRGSGLASALNVGQIYLQTMVRTATLDTARSSDLTAMSAHRYTHYVREISAGACSRCAMLAGIASSRTPFLRHPGCRCTAVPVPEGGEKGVPHRFTSPDAYFASMTAAEQDRIFTRAGAEAIRAGADPIAVVSARRGARGIAYSGSIVDGRTLPHSGRMLERAVIGHRPDGTPILGYVTGEGTTSRGDFAKRQRVAGVGTRKVGTRSATTKRIRLMPETIVELTGDPGLRQVLLRDAGYLDYPTTAAERSQNIGAYLRRRDDIIREDRQIADAFYRSRGISLG